METSSRFSQFMIFSLLLHVLVFFWSNNLNISKPYNTEPIIALKLNNLIIPSPEKTVYKKEIIENKVIEKDISTKPIIPKENLKPQTASKEQNSISKLARTNYENILASWIEKYKKYPKKALRRRQQGLGLLYVKINKSGEVLSYKLNTSTKSTFLDEEIIRMVKKASPLPVIPDDLKISQYEFIIPIEFKIK